VTSRWRFYDILRCCLVLTHPLHQATNMSSSPFKMDTSPFLTFQVSDFFLPSSDGSSLPPATSLPSTTLQDELAPCHVALPEPSPPQSSVQPSTIRPSPQCGSRIRQGPAYIPEDRSKHPARADATTTRASRGEPKQVDIVLANWELTMD
jgi:hypothetical protein